MDSAPGVGLRVRVCERRAVLCRRSGDAGGVGRHHRAARRASRGNRPRSRASSPRSKRNAARRPASRESAARLADPATRVDHHRPAGRAVRRTALHAAEGDHDHEAGGAGVARASRARGAGVLDRRRGSRLAGGQRLYGARQRARAGHGAACRLAGRRLPADRPADADRRHPSRPRPTHHRASRHRIQVRRA